MDGRWNSFGRFRVVWDRVRSGDGTFPRRQLVYTVQVSPSRGISQIILDGYIGKDVDFANSRSGHGGNVTLSGAFHPTDHFELIFNGQRRWLDVESETGGRERLFTAQLSRLRAVYTFTARAFLRVIGQYVETRRDPSLYDPVLFPSSVPRKSAAFSGSALFAYKLNWQSVLFVGYGDDRALTTYGSMEPAGRQIFMKVSYAFQR